MKKIITLCTVFAVAFFVLNGVITQASNRDSFMVDAAESSMAEVMLSNLALQKSQNEQVRTFAQQMVTDHTAANQELTTLAASKNVTLPTAPDSKHQSAMTKLGGMSGTEFDRAYMKQMVKDHEDAVKLFSREAERGTDADTKAFAAKMLPALQGHLQMARGLNDTVRGGNNNGGNNNGGNMNSNRGNTNDMNMNSNSGNMNNMNMNSNQNTNMNRNTNSNRGNNTNSNRNNNTNSNRNNNNTNTNTNTNSNTNVNRM